MRLAASFLLVFAFLALVPAPSVRLPVPRRRGLLQSGNGLYVDAEGASLFHLLVLLPFAGLPAYAACAATNAAASSAQPYQLEGLNQPSNALARARLNPEPCDYRLCTGLYTSLCRRRRRQ